MREPTYRTPRAVGRLPVMPGTAKRPTKPRGDSRGLAREVENLKRRLGVVEARMRAMIEDAGDYRASTEAAAEAREKGSRPWETVKAELGL